MYVPKSKQVKNPKIKGILKTVTGLIYVGIFVQDYLGNFYKGAIVNSKSEPLTYVPAVEEEETSYSESFNYFKPTDKDYLKGTFLRYFIKDLRTSKITETGYSQYIEQQSLNRNYKQFITVEWYIIGPSEDTLMGGYLYPGAKAKNIDVTQKAEDKMPGISNQVLIDPKQFVI